MNVLVLSNPGAARARRRLPALREALPAAAGLSHQVVERPEQLATLVGHDRWQPDDLLVINGGDGSVQRALTALLAGCSAHRLPRVACLPGGTTNMTAFDLNRHRGFSDCLQMLRAVTAGSSVAGPIARPLVQVRQAAGEASRCGLFFGMGTIVQGIEYFHERVRPAGGRHELGAGVALARALLGIVRRQPPFSDPLPVNVDAPALLAGGCRRMNVRLLLATTLDRLFLGIRPYWGSGPGALKSTLVESEARRFLASMPRLLRGRPGPHMSREHGYYSERLDALTLQFRGSYTLDGELFPSAGDTMAVSASQPVRFVSL